MAVIGVPISSDLPDRIRFLAKIPTTISDDQLNENLATAEAVLDASGASDSITSDTLLDTIRVYLGAHFTVISMGGEISEISIMQSSQKFTKSGASGGLRETAYGRTAIMLDTTGKLNEFSKNAEKTRVKPMMKAIGTEIKLDVDWPETGTTHI